MKSLKLSNLIIAAFVGLFSILAFDSALTLPTYAIDCSDSSISAEVKTAAGCNTETTLPNVIVNILNAIILVAGIVAVIFIIIGGVNYMTSSGDAGKVAKAKNTILYALIGLVICVLAFAIVNWTIGVLDKA
ncbi:hypothetical protein IJG28_02825 [Candidatus Saccharibacteria bacterium]|nr:hypothetical protein [Candidatus Saccharibacteria bacterium]